MVHNNQICSRTMVTESLTLTQVCGAVAIIIFQMHAMQNDFALKNCDVMRLGLFATEHELLSSKVHLT